MADAPQKQKPRTRDALEADLNMCCALYADLERQLRGKENEIKEMRGRIDTLKTRLADAEFQNARMRGYIEREQEDDVVREELLTVTDAMGPPGATTLVPKRKPARFDIPPLLVANQDAVEARYASNLHRPPPPPPPVPWVTYCGAIA
ncbi:MAG: hypothetical protein HXY30_14870 [Pseudorhodoplanes sp.]|nr:hypothetical protein [Pseudorhodoplanes sp.]